MPLTALAGMGGESGLSAISGQLSAIGRAGKTLVVGGHPLKASHVEVLAEVELAGLGVVDEELARALGHDLALADDVAAVDDAEGLADVVVGDEHADPALLELQDDLLNFGHGDRVDAGKRFVEEEELRAGNERAGDLKAA